MECLFSYFFLVAITLMDPSFKLPVADANGDAAVEENKDKQTTSAVVNEENDASKAIRELVTKAAAEKSWLKIKVAREQPTAAETQPAGFVPISVSDFDPRGGLIRPKMTPTLWRYIVEVELASAEVTEGVNLVMSKFL
jgi:hypothetical protein